MLKINMYIIFIQVEYQKRDMRWHFMKLTFDPHSPVIVITSTFIGVNDKRKKINMALDTGATYTMVP